MTNRELYTVAVTNWTVSTFSDLLPSVNVFGFNLGGLKYATPLVAIPLKRKILEMSKYIDEADVPEFMDEFIALSIKEADTKGSVDIFGVTLKRSDFEDLRKHINEAIKSNTQADQTQKPDQLMAASTPLQ